VSVTLNVTVDDGNSRTGVASIETVAPDVTVAVDGNEGILTEGLNSTVDYTVEDPRDGSAFDSGTVAVEAVNATFEVDTDVDGTVDTTLADGGTAEISLDENGQATVAIGVQGLADDVTSPNLLHNARTSAASAGAGNVELPVGSPNIFLFEDGERADLPDTVAPNSQVDFTFEVTDANDRNIPVDGVDFTVDGAGFDSSTTPLDEGFVDVSGEVTSGTIDLTIDDVESVSLAQIDALETASLSLTANQTDIAQNDTVEFSLIRLDVARQTQGQLNITNADGESVETVDIDGTTTVTFDNETYAAGDYTVEATKPSGSQTAFNASTVTVTVDGGVDTGSPLDGTAGEYDADGDGQVTASELGNAVTAFGQGNLTASELGDVVTAFGQS